MNERRSLKEISAEIHSKYELQSRELLDLSRKLLNTEQAIHLNSNILKDLLDSFNANDEACYNEIMTLKEEVVRLSEELTTKTKELDELKVEMEENSVINYSEDSLNPSHVELINLLMRVNAITPAERDTYVAALNSNEKEYRESMYANLVDVIKENLEHKYFDPLKELVPMFKNLSAHMRDNSVIDQKEHENNLLELSKTNSDTQKEACMHILEVIMKEKEEDFVFDPEKHTINTDVVFPEDEEVLEELIESGAHPDEDDEEKEEEENRD